jgi:hypothetical protein
VTILVACLIIAGAALTTVGAIIAYRGRMREDPEHPGLFTIPKGGGVGLTLAILGAVVALASGLIGLAL